MKNTCNKKRQNFIFSVIYCLFFIIFNQQLLTISSLSSAKLSVIENKYPYNYYNKRLFDKKSWLTNKDNNKEPWSDAFNFDKAWGTQTDLRTGMLTTFIKVGSMISNLGHGPDINLKVSYSSVSRANPDNLGSGWSWNLTHFNLHTNQLTTRKGENFYLQKDIDGQWKPLYHKLRDIDIRNDKDNSLIITYADGLRETLNNNGYTIRLEQQDGNAVNFFYTPDTYLLTKIADNQNHYIKIIHHENYITVISQGIRGQPVKVVINNANNQIRSIVLPVQNSISRPGIYITYTGHLITALNYPTGLKKIFAYNCENAIRMAATDKQSNLSLCAVSAETVITGVDQPPLITHYAYSNINANGHDYLGFNSGLPSIFISDHSERDLLFEVPADYTYRTLEDNQLIKEMRTYNKYHLLIDDKKISDRTGHILSETENFYCRTDKHNGCAHTSFENLPATYNLPLKTVTKTWGNIDGQPDINTVTSTYDKSGRLIYSKDNYGRTVKLTYCPVKGDIACPPMPAGSMFSVLPESITAYPAKKNTTHTEALPVITYNHYRRNPNRTDSGYILLLDQQVHQSGSARAITDYYYYNDVHNALTYGLLKKTVFKKVYNNLSPVPSQIRYYYYTLNHDEKSKTIYSSVMLKGGKFQRLPAMTTSLFTNQIIQKTNVTGTNITRYHYDNYGRLIQKDMAVNTPFVAYTHYDYSVSPELNQILITAANGLQKKTIFDSAGRKLQEWNEAISATGRADPNQWLLNNQFDYDRYGHLARVYHYTMSASKKTDKLITVYHYDEMGAVTKVTLPDRQRIVRLYNDPERCIISYRESSNDQRSAITVVHYNELDKPIQHIILPAFQGTLSAVKKLCYCHKWQQDARIFKRTYDGFGREVSVTDPAGRTKTKIYNSLGEMVAIKDSSGHKIYYSYDLTGHLIKTYKQYKTATGFGGWLMYSAQYNLVGQLIWKQNSSQQTTSYTYTADGYPATITTPAGHIISFIYNRSGLPVAKYIDGKLQLKNNYNPVTSLLIKRTDSTGITRYAYGDDGVLQKEIHTGNSGYTSYSLQWFYDLNRRLTAVTDISGNKTSRQYDLMGRVTALYYQALRGKHQLLAKFAYDDFARTTIIHYGSGMQRNIDYDSYDRRYQVKDTLNNQLLFQWNYTYDVVNNIIQLKQQGKNSQTSLLNYQYDAQNNLTAMTCHGSSGLPFCPRDTDFSGSGLHEAPVIIRQDYHFNPLNRMTELKEVLQNSLATITLSKAVSYHYYNNAPLRLKRLKTEWNNNLPADSNFNYDKAGNMIVDGQGNQITYNPFNQATSVLTAEGEHSYYSYNGSGKEITEKTPFSIHHLFYRGHHLINESIYNDQDKTTHIAGYQNIARTMDGVIDQYYEKNYKGDVTGVLTRKQSEGRYALSQSNTYSPYGMSWHHSESAILFYQQLLTGFNSERSDPVTHWQFLGAGHRTYNAQQHYFVSEDPAGDGYAFAANNPIMKSDPDGNLSRKALRKANDIINLGINYKPLKLSNILAIIIVGVISIASIGFGTMLTTKNPSLMLSGGVSAFFTTLISCLLTLVKGPQDAKNIAQAVTGSISLAISLVGGIEFLGVAGFYGVKAAMSASCWTAGVEGISAENMAAANVAELSGDIPLVSIRNVGASTDLGQDLLHENSSLPISEENGISYLTLQSDEQQNDTVLALRQVRSMDDNIAAALTASKLTRKPLALSSIDSYLEAIQEDPFSSLLDPSLSETQKNALSNLFEPFGELQSGENGRRPVNLFSTGNKRFIGRNLTGTFVVYTDENSPDLTVVKYNYVQCVMERLNVSKRSSNYTTAYHYVVF